MDQKPSFWSTLPGVLTAVAAIVGAAAALITALHGAGMFGASPTRQSAPEVSADVRSNAGQVNREVPAQQARTDRSDARSTAQAILTAFQRRDVIALAGLTNQVNKQIFVELAEQGEGHPRYDLVFEGWRWEIVEAWDGGLSEARYRHFVGSARDSYEAQVQFADMGTDEIGVVTMTWEGNQWAFEDINSPDRADFNKGSESFRVTPEAY